MHMQLNPEVTVRERGVMEKCTFCVQRIHQGKNRAKLEDRKVKDGDVQTACQASCPTHAMVSEPFGVLDSGISIIAHSIAGDAGFATSATSVLLYLYC